MDPINRETRTSVHFSINYTLAIAWTPDKAKAVDFQKALLDNGLDFAQTNLAPGLFSMIRQQPSNLQLKLQAHGPQVSSIQIISANPSCDLEMFSQEALAVTEAYQQTWQAPQYQVIRTAAKIQHLYSCQTHGFQYLWETRLGQSSEDFKCFGQRPVAGGGLRLVMPPHAVADEEPRSIEIRLESFLREPKKLLVETTFVWPKPRVIQNNQKFDPAQSMQAIEEYAANEVWQFLTQNSGQRGL